MRIRRIFTTLALAAAALAAPLDAAAARPDGSLVVVVDPGHGGDKDGAIGPGGLKEKEVALAISLRLEAALREAGHEVILTRRDDTGLDLGPRIQLANERGADLFVSVHANSMPTAEARARTSGIETYFLSPDATDEAAAAVAQKENSDDAAANAPKELGAVGMILADLARSEAHVNSSQLAYVLHEAIVKGTGGHDRGVRQAPFFVLEGAQMPAVLLEVGYISHRTEARRLADAEQQERIARAVARGIERFRRDVLQKQARSTLGGKPGAAALQP
ncbi:N-acetylmuramoyl-L-alanine amidase [Vulgatibacter sp.]|uniref:N-acetylmuramoyl-L-alanine amidase family protein n=1 Tax=Vulgatibacter sp. TaxID=1971226 RepID=UPI003562B9BD